jgi:chromate reductase, NAD(P)H dehydrogenase (quinone)
MKRWLLIGCLLVTTPVLAEVKALVFAGSTRADSYNKKLASEAAELVRKTGAVVTTLDLKDYPMPFYDADLEKKSGMPKQAKRFRQHLIHSDLIVIASPEYNSSIPAVLKNALDWASRGEDGKSSKEAFKGKKFIIMSASPGKGGGARGLIHLRAIIEDVGGQVIEPSLTIPLAHKYFTEKQRPELSLLKEGLQRFSQSNVAQ